MQNALNFLLLEDEPDDAELTEEALRKAGIVFLSKRVDTREGFITALEEYRPDIILADYHLPTFDGMTALTIAVERAPDVPFIFVSGAMGEELAIETLHLGAADYVIKDRLGKLAPAVSRALHQATEQRLRRQAEADLAESEERFRKMAESALDGLVIIDENELITYWNRAAEKMFVYTVAEALGRPVHELLAPAEHRDVFRHRRWSGFRDTGKGPVIGHTREIVALRKGGERFPVEVSVSSMTIDGRWHAAAIARDITERKRVEQELKAHAHFLESMDRVNQAIQSASGPEQMMSDVLDVVLSIFDCDRAFLMYPCDPDAPSWRVPMERNKPGYPGAHALEHEIPMDAEVARGLRELLATDHPLKFGPETDHPLPEEAARQFGFRSFMSIAIYPKIGKPWQFGMHQCAYARVWTQEEERLLHEIGRRVGDGLSGLLSHEKVQESEQKFRALAENFPDYLVRFDSDCRIVYVNSELSNEFDLPLETIMGKRLCELPESVAEAPHFMLDACVGRVLATGEADDYDAIWNTDRGKRIVEIRHIPERDAAGKVVSVLGIGRNITALKEAEQHLEESRTQLRGLTARREEAREEERKHIAREVHDELGQILTGLKMNVSILAYKYATSSEALSEHVQETMMLTDRAMSVARNVASALRPAALDLGITSALEWLAGRFGTNTGIHCQVRIEDCEIGLDEKNAIALFRIVQESLTNVARYAKASNVVVELDKDADDYVLKVRDNGIGFDASATKKDSFGLVGIRERAFMLGGTVAINSRPGNGTEVVVRIPAQKISEES